MKIYTELIDLSNDIRQTFLVSPFSDYKMGVKVVQNVGFKVMDGDTELSPENELIDGYTIYSLKSTTPGRKTYKVVCNNGQSIPIVEVTQKSTVYDVGSVKKTSELENDSGFIGADEVNTMIADKADKTQLPTKTSELVNDSGFIGTDVEQELRSGITQATEIANTAQSDVNALRTNVQQNTTTLGQKADRTELPTKTSELVNDSGFATNASVDEKIGGVTSSIPTKTSQLNNDAGYTTQSYVDSQIGNVLTQEEF